MKRLVIGSKNPKKKREILEILGGLPFELVDLTQCKPVAEVIEDGDTFEANAAKKASQVALELGEWVLGEDSGLCVDALGGAPGIFSARYAGVQGDDEANNEAKVRKTPAHSLLIIQILLMRLKPRFVPTLQHL